MSGTHPDSSCRLSALAMTRVWWGNSPALTARFTTDCEGSEREEDWIIKGKRKGEGPKRL